MRKYFFFALLILFLLSCSEEKEEAMTLDSIIPTSDHYSDNQTEENTEQKTTFEPQLIDSLVAKNELVIDSTKEIETFLFPDRYTSTSKVKFEYKSISNLSQFHSWEFDNSQGLDIIHNWLNCFGDKCNQFYIGQEKKMQTEGFLLLANSSNITYITSITRKEQLNWINYYKAAESNNWDFVITQSSYQKAKWNKMIDGELETYTDNTNILPKDEE